MRLLLVVLLAALTLMVLSGCSEKQKEADRLGQEMEGLAGGDSGAQAAATADTTAASPAAIPKEAAPEPSRPAMPAQPAGTGYTVQIASCESEQYARHLVDLYTERGYEPFVTTITYNDQTYHRVRIGSFEAYSGAASLKRDIEDRYSVSGVWIDRLDQ